MFVRTQSFLWYMFVFLLPWQTVFLAREVWVGDMKWEYGTIGVYAFEVALALWLTTVVWEKRESFSWKTILVIGGFASVTGVALIGSVDRVLSASILVVCVLGIGLVWGLSQTKIHTRKTVWIFLCAVFFQSLIGIGQYAFQYNPAVTLLGMAEHIPESAGTSVLKTDEGRVLRAYGGMAHPNIFGGVLAVATLFAVCLWITARSARERVGATIGTGIFLFTLVITFSRSAWLGFVIGFFVFFAWVFMYQKVWRARAIPIFLLTICMAGIFFWMLGTIAFSRFDAEVVAREGSFQDRSDLLVDSFAVWRENALLGVGPGASTLAMMQQEFGGDLLVQENVPVWAYQPAHSVPILFLVEWGVFGMLLLGGLFVIIGKGVVRAIRGDSVCGAVFASALLALFPVLLLDHWLLTQSFGILFFSFLVGMLMIENERKNDEVRSKKYNP